MKINYKVFLYLFLALILVSAIYFRNNADKIYSSIGDYYQKNNNISQALTFYDKALAINEKDGTLREKVTNLVINSPMTIESQEKLVKIVKANQNDAADKNANYFLYNIKREINNKYHDNYIQQGTYNQKIIHWGKLPITYGFKNQYFAPEELVKSVILAFDEWERVSSGRVKFKHVKMNPDIWVEFIKEDVNSPEFGRKYIVGYTTPVISQNTLENMIIKLNIQNLDGDIYSPNQIYNTALHEIFHALGFMGHSYNKNNIMHMSKNNDSVTDDTKVALTYADKVTLELLYKIKPDITNANELKYYYIPYLIFGGSEDVNYTKLNEAKNYIRKAPTLPNGYIDLADVLVSQKRYKEASDALEKAYYFAKNNDTKYIILYNLAVANFYQNLPNLALDYVNSAKQIADNNELHYLAAEIYLKQNNIEKAIEEYNYLINKDSDNIDYAINLANIYIKEKHFMKARNVLKNYIKNNPQEKNNPKLASYKKLFL